MKLEGRALLIFGSRSLDDDRIDRICEKFLSGGGYRYIVTALDPRGVCERAKHYAKACRDGVTLIQVGLDRRRAQGMHEARSIAALKMADHMLAIWDGASKGTANEIELARKMGVPTTVVRLEPIEEMEIDGDFDVDTNI